MRRFTLAAAGVLAALALATSIQARSERVAVVDPAELQALGYPPGTANIYRLASDIADPAASSQHDETGVTGRSAMPFPTGTTGFTTAAGFAFFPLTHTYEYVKGPSFLVLGGGLTSITVGGFYEAQLALPSHAFLRWLEVFGFHSDDGGPLAVSLVERCLPYLSSGNPEETVLASGVLADQDGNFMYSHGLSGHVVNARECSYHVRVRFSESGATSPALLMQLAKARVQWTPDRIFNNGFEPSIGPPILAE